jgi:arylformamidase
LADIAAAASSILGRAAMTRKTAVYRDYDQRALDAQYDNRGLVADHQRYLDAYAANSARARRERACRLDIAYGTGPLETLDLFPASAPGAPVHLFIHGGYWRGLDKDAFSYLAPPWVDVGAAFVAINYALAPAVTVADIVRQCRVAVAWVAHHGSALGVDGSRLFISGHSAGGHLVAMMLSTDWSRVDPAMPAGAVIGGCAISGLYDLEPIRRSFLQADLHLDSETVSTCSPIRVVPKRAPPLLITVGERESPEYLRQQAEFVASWRRASLLIEELPAPGQHHFSIIDTLGEPGGLLFEAVQRRLLGQD